MMAKLLRAALTALVLAAVAVPAVAMCPPVDNCTPQEGLAVIRALADDGNGDAQYFLGAMYEDGHAVRRDYARAYMWYLLALRPEHHSPEAAQMAAARIFALQEFMAPAQIAEAQKRAGEWRPHKALGRL
jgi:TPR repeat protein